MVRISFKAFGRRVADATARYAGIAVARTTPLRVLLVLGAISLTLYIVYRCIKKYKWKCMTQIPVFIPCTGSVSESEPSCEKGASMANACRASAINFVSFLYQPLRNNPKPWVTLSGTNHTTSSVIRTNRVQESATAMAQQCQLPPSYTDAVFTSPGSPVTSNIVTLPPRIDHLETTDHPEPPLRPPRRLRIPRTTTPTTPMIPTSPISQQQSTRAADI